MITAEEARWIISFREPEKFVRLAWVLATENISVAVGIDMRTGATVGEKWIAVRPEPPYLLVCAYVPATRKAELPVFLMPGPKSRFRRKLSRNT